MRLSLSGILYIYVEAQVFERIYLFSRSDVASKVVAWFKPYTLKA